MKKSLIALAVAGTFVAAPAFAATSNVDVYGRMNISIEDSNGTDVTPQVTDRQSFVGVKGSEDLGGGLKAIWQIESTISAGYSDGVGGATLAGRNSFVGLSGGFGTVLAGRHDTPYKLSTGRLDLFADTVADYNGDGAALATTGKDGFTQLVMAAHDHRSNNAVAYVSPSFGGFSFAAAVVMTNRNTGAGLIGVDDNDANKTFDATSLSGTYANGPLFLTGAYQHAADLSIAAGETKSPAWKLGAGYSFGDAKVGFIFEDVEVETGGVKSTDRTSWMLNAGYGMGPLTLKAQYGIVNDKMAANLDQSKFSLGADYALSKRSSAGFAYTTDKTKNNASGSANAWGVQMRHSF
ncbi:MAG: porin [Pseudomonadota bacterium]|nr:porin [Pseudomonadota bacterium]MDP1905735.1 porin [Pseudomonadota bacterium]MDP2351349.1 porin [Pseudomonadota bacterium]